MGDEQGRRTVFSIDADIQSPGYGGRRAVVSDEDADQREALSRHLTERGFHVSLAMGGLDALSIIGAEAPSVVLLHSERDGDDGERTAALAAMLYPQTRIIITASVDAPEDGRSPDELFPILRRPVNLDQLDRCLDGLTA